MKKDKHFVKEIEYHYEPWLRDFIFGLKYQKPHGHFTISGATIIWYLRDEIGRERVKNGFVVS